MDTRVFKAEQVNELWKNYPSVFRVAMLPFIVALVLQYRLNRKQFVFVRLGNTGDTLDLVNDQLLMSPDDPGPMKTAAYAAESFLVVEDYENPLRNFVMTVLAVTQTIVWCVNGENIHAVVLGEHGAIVPDWAWEVEQQGPRVKNVRIISFDPVPEE